MPNANSLSEFMDCINDYFKSHQVPKKNLLYRGQSNEEWGIVSSAYRFLQEKYPSLQIEPDMLNDFESKLHNNVKYISEINTSPDSSRVLCMLQHLGGRTPLIDFSKDCCIALYFACESYQGTRNGTVYILNKGDNDEVFNNNGIIVGQYKEIKIERENAAFARVHAQKACFVKLVTKECALNKDNVYKITIDKNYKKQILEQLLCLNINRETMYPDIFDFINHQTQYSYLDSFKENIFRNVSQIVKGGCIKKMDSAIKSLDALSDNINLGEHDLLRIKYLKIQCFICSQKFDNALNMLDTIQCDFEFFEPFDKYPPTLPKHYDPITSLFIVEFLKAKCYVEQNKYKLAEKCYDKAAALIDKIENSYGCENWRVNMEIDNFWKSYAKALVKWMPSKLFTALTFLKNCKGQTTSDKGELYLLAGELDDARKILILENNDYAYNLLGSYYLELAKTNDETSIIDEAINYYSKAIDDLALRINDNSIKGYINPTSSHDHYYHRAIANRKRQKFESAETDYKIIIQPPYENEDAMHDLAYMYFKDMDNRELDALKYFFYAIENSRMNKNPRNFNDLGRLLFDVYKKNLLTNDKKLVDFMNKLKEHIDKLIVRIERYPETVQLKLKELSELGKRSSDFKYILKTSEFLFKIANSLSNKDAYANKKLGDVYIELANDKSLKEEEVIKLKQNALNSYYLANCFYFLDNKFWPDLDKKIECLKYELRQKTVIFNEDE